MNKKSFTLIEVIVAVMIISVVIGALLQMRGGTTTMFKHLQKTSQTTPYFSLFLWNNKYGFEKESLPLSRLVENIDLDSDLRRQLKNIKVKIAYNKLKEFNTSGYSNSPINVELGEEKVSIQQSNIKFVRIRLQ
jgi:prepilin-type N-terminal cleavage/methylation domain-containing protein